MADISKITLEGGQSYDIKDAVAMSYPYQRPLDTKTYTDVIATTNDNVGGAFFYAKVRATTYRTRWRVKLRIQATVPGSASNADLYNTDSIYEIWGVQNTYLGYCCENKILSTSYRPIYYNCNFRVSSTGYNNGCGNWLGFSLYNATNCLNASYKRTVIVDLLEYQDCEVELQNTLVTSTDIPNRSAHTDWYSSTYSSFDNLDCYTQGYRFTGDQNTTTITNLCDGSGSYIADSAIYRYQLLFHVSDDILSPLNNDNNVVATTKTMLTSLEFDPFARIYYWNSTTAYSAGGTIVAGTGLAYACTLDARYTFNCGTTLTAHKNIYLKVTPLSNGKCTLASDSPWVQDLPTTEDGYWYIFLGRTYSTYQFKLYDIHPVYVHNGTEVVRVLPKNNNSGGGGSGDVSSITMNGTSYTPTSGVVDLGTVLTDDSGFVHTTTAESIAGLKTFTEAVIKTGTDAVYRGYDFINSSGNVLGEVLIHCGDGQNTNLITAPRMYFRVYSGKSTAAVDSTGYYEHYRLPAATAGLAESKTYDIVTTKDVDLSIAGVKTFTDTTASSSTATGAVIVKGGLGVAKYIYGSRVYNAVWNDYAECRKVDTTEAGYCVKENQNGSMTKTSKRLEAGCKITSDTFGSCMGETKDAKTPIAVAGRVLAYPFSDKKKFKLGKAVCSAPGGKIDVMSRIETILFPDRIVGYVSEIPSYEVWECGSTDNPQEVKVNGRIWVYVR